MAATGCVLVVDDEIDIWLTVGGALRDVGYDVMAAANGAEAFVLMTERLPDVVLLDLRMPVMNSREFVDLVRARWVAPVPVVMMTTGFSARLWAGELLADAVLPKPFDLGQLVAVVRRFTRAQAAP